MTSIPTNLAGVPYGPAPRAAGPAGALSLPPRLVVIHDTSNTASAQDEAHYAATRTDAQASWTSAHFYVDATGPLGSLPLTKQAWAAYSYANQHGWHIEMCGTDAGTSTAVPAVTIAHTAALVRQLCALAGIPVTHLGPADVAAGRSGICGHWDITSGLHVGTHTDPGKNFDWGHFISLVKGGGDNEMIDFSQQSTIVKGISDAQVLQDIWAMTVQGRPGGDATVSRFKAPNGWAQIQATLSAAAAGGGGLTDADRELIKGLTDAVTGLAHQLATP